MSSPGILILIIWMWCVTHTFLDFPCYDCTLLVRPTNLFILNIDYKWGKHDVQHCEHQSTVWKSVTTHAGLPGFVVVVVEILVEPGVVIAQSSLKWHRKLVHPQRYQPFSQSDHQPFFALFARVTTDRHRPVDPHVLEIGHGRHDQVPGVQHHPARVTLRPDDDVHTTAKRVFAARRVHRGF